MPAELFTPQNIKFNETIICCCICYEKYWQDLRKKSENVTHTDFNQLKIEVFENIFSEKRSFFTFVSIAYKKFWIRYRKPL